jgi:phosphinothricin acetyltransferase
MPRIRIASVSDAPRLLEIYSWYCNFHSSTSELFPPSLEDFTDRIRRTLEFFPYFVIEEDLTHRIVGYTYGSSWRPPGHDWIALTSIYVDHEERGRNYGTILYRKLLAALKDQHFVAAFAVLTFPNPGSQRFHERCGFELRMELPPMTYKLGKWRGQAIMSIDLNPREIPPELTVPFPQLDPAKYVDD